MNLFGKDNYSLTAKELLNKIWIKYDIYRDTDEFKSLNSEEKQIIEIVQDFKKLIKLILKLEIQLIEKFNLLSENYEIGNLNKEDFREDIDNEEKQLDIVWKEFITDLLNLKIIGKNYSGFYELQKKIRADDILWYHRKYRERNPITPFKKGESKEIDNLLDIMEKIESSDEHKELVKKIKVKIKEVGLDMPYDDVLTYVQNFQTHLDSFENKSYLKKIADKAKSLGLEPIDFYAKIAELSKDIEFYK